MVSPWPEVAGWARTGHISVEDNDLLSCFGAKGRAVNCSVAVVLGVATTS